MLNGSTMFQQKHLHWLASAAQQDSVASLTLHGWDMSREQRNAAASWAQRRAVNCPLYY